MLTINPVYTNSFNNKYQMQQKNVSFGSTDSFKIQCGRIIYKNTTCFFREGLDWADIADRIIQDGKKIYCYACSDGSEPFTIALSIINKVGFDKAAKNFKIIARDIDERVINRARACAISLDSNDKSNIRKFVNPEYVRLFRDLSSMENTHIVDKKLADCVDFSLGNLIYDVDNMDCRNSVVFFRNVWPYLNDTDKYLLRNKLAERFDNKSLLVVGYFDTAQSFYGKEPAFEKFMTDGGFRKVAHNVYSKIN